jgi:hypothetical protein
MAHDVARAILSIAREEDYREASYSLTEKHIDGDDDGVLIRFIVRYDRVEITLTAPKNHTVELFTLVLGDDVLDSHERKSTLTIPDDEDVDTSSSWSRQLLSALRILAMRRPLINSHDNDTSFFILLEEIIYDARYMDILRVLFRKRKMNLHSLNRLALKYPQFIDANISETIVATLSLFVSLGACSIFDDLSNVFLRACTHPGSADVIRFLITLFGSLDMCRVLNPAMKTIIKCSDDVGMIEVILVRSDILQIETEVFELCCSHKRTQCLTAILRYINQHADRASFSFSESQIFRIAKNLVDEEEAEVFVVQGFA